MLRIGALAPHVAIGSEEEIPAIAPGRAVTCVAGLSARAVEAGFDEAADLLGLAGVDVIGYASTSSAYAIGREAEVAFASRLSRRVDVPVAATCASFVQARRGREDRGAGHLRVAAGGALPLLHTVDARVGEEQVEGAEIIAWEPARGAYVTQYFGSDGPNACEANLAVESGVLVWTMRSEVDRFAGRFSDDGNTLTGEWERLDDENGWQPWMEVTLTRLADEP